MTGANSVRKSVVWWEMTVQSTTPWCVRIDALIHTSCTSVNMWSQPTGWLHDHDCSEKLSFPTLLHGKLRHPEMTSQVSFSEGVFIRAVQIGISKAPGAVAATSSALASRWEMNCHATWASKPPSSKRAAYWLCRTSCTSLPCRFSRTKHTELIKRYHPFWCFLSLYCHSTKYDLQAPPYVRSYWIVGRTSWQSLFLLVNLRVSTQWFG